jgi:hypothetical protein
MILTFGFSALGSPLACSHPTAEARINAVALPSLQKDRTRALMQGLRAEASGCVTPERIRDQPVGEPSASSVEAELPAFRAFAHTPWLDQTVDAVESPSHPRRSCTEPTRTPVRIRSAVLAGP